MQEASPNKKKMKKKMELNREAAEKIYKDYCKIYQ